MSSIVPTKIAAAATSVIDLVVEGERSAGRYAFCRRGELLLVAVADLALGEQPGGGDRDDDQGDGEAAEQRERHREGERPEELRGETGTMPRGRKTATVVRVLAVIAPATSRVPV